MPSKPTIAPEELGQLRLEKARALLAQTGSTTTGCSGQSVSELQQLIDELCELSLKDALTGLANRRHFQVVIDRELDRVGRRTGETALLLMVDVDHFKRINDTYGHQIGDLVLQAVARSLNSCVRPMDTLARYGGEEFAVILPGCQVAFGEGTADRLRQAVERNPIQLPDGTLLHTTVSIGGAFALPWDPPNSHVWVERADRQLYLAKSAGRNRICLENPADSTVSAEEKGMLFSHLSGLPAKESENMSFEAINGATRK